MEDPPTPHDLHMETLPPNTRQHKQATTNSEDEEEDDDSSDWWFPPAPITRTPEPEEANQEHLPAEEQQQVPDQHEQGGDLLDHEVQIMMQQLQGAAARYPANLDPVEQVGDQVDDETEDDDSQLHQTDDELGYVADQEDQAQIHLEEEPIQMNQPRQPVKGDIIAYWHHTSLEWITAKVTNKVQGYKHYYNIEMEDGRTDGLYCRPPTKRSVEQWTLLDDHHWHPQVREQLLSLPHEIPSRQVTPETTPEQLRLSDHQEHHTIFPYQEEGLQLALDPDQDLQVGRVHVLPQYQYQVEHQLNSEPVRDEKYDRRVQEIYQDLVFPPSQEHLRLGHAHFLAYSEQYQKKNSTFAKLKKTFHFGKR